VRRNSVKLHWEWNLPNPALLIRVRNIEVVINASVDTGTKMAWDDRCRTEWPYLFLDERKPATARELNWQNYFTNVTHLKIVNEFAPHHTLAKKTCLDSCLASCVKEMRWVRVKIMPMKVEIEVRGLHCPEASECNGVCEASITTAIRQAVEIRSGSADGACQTTPTMTKMHIDDHPRAVVAREGKRKR
jgi:hypothetical protein